MKSLGWPRLVGDDSNRDKAARVKARHRVLVADEDTPFARRLATYLHDHGFESRVAANVVEAKELIEFWQPETVFVSLLLPETNALSLFKFIHTRSLRKQPKMIVMSKQALLNGVEQMRKAGANHYLVKPFPLEEAFRAVTLTTDEAMLDAAPAAKLVSSTIKELHLLNLFLRQATVTGESNASLFNLMRMINLKVNASRCSLIQVLQGDKGRVLASNDDDKVTGFELDLTKYPEIQELRRRLSPVLIPNVRSSDLLNPVRERIERTPFESIILFPVFRCGTFFGALSLRMRQRDPMEIFYIEKFGEVCAQILSLAIGTPGQRLIAD